MHFGRSTTSTSVKRSNTRLGLGDRLGDIDSKSPKKKSHLSSDLKLEISVMRTPIN